MSPGTSSRKPHHVALLGDSIFDNAAYTGAEPDVVTHLRSRLPVDSRATLLAVDGARIRDLESQLRRVPADVTRLIISVGGNDALENADLLATPVTTTTAALTLFSKRVAKFEAAYRKAIDSALELARPTTLCTIYNGNLDRTQAAVARIALMIFNDAILRVAFERALGVLDLRLICNLASDYANPIEPSGTGGQKIAASVVRTLDVPPAPGYSTVVS